MIFFYFVYFIDVDMANRMFLSQTGWYDPLFIIIWIKINEVIGPSRNNRLPINSNQMGSNNGEQQCKGKIQSNPKILDWWADLMW